MESWKKLVVFAASREKPEMTSQVKIQVHPKAGREEVAGGDWSRTQAAPAQHFDGCKLPTLVHEPFSVQLIDVNLFCNWCGLRCPSTISTYTPVVVLWLVFCVCLELEFV